MSRFVAGRPTALMAKVYAVALVGLLVIAALLTSVALFAFEARDTLRSMESDTVKRSALVLGLSDLNGQQRRAVVGLLAETDEAVRASGRHKLDVIGDQMRALAQLASDAHEVEVTDKLSQLAADADDLTRTPLSAQAPEQNRLGLFLQRSDELDRQLHGAVERRSAATLVALDALSDSGERMAFWIAAISIGLAGVGVPAVVLWIVRLLRRIRRITRTMHRIADCETSVDVPSTVDGDEVGDLARAVQAFKRSAIALRRNTDEITRLNGWFDLALNNMQRGLSIFDDEQRLVMCNDRYREIYDLPAHLVRPGTPLSAIIEGWMTQSEQSLDVSAILANYRSLLDDGNEFVRVHTLADNRVVVVTYKPLPEGGWVDVHEDVTDRIQTDKTIQDLAQNDLLTGLRNRHSFLEHVGQLLAARAEPDVLAVVLIDLCNFKRVNETFGHKVGDEVLKTLAQRLKLLDVAGGNLARTSGDGFALVLSGCSIADVEACAGEICTRVAGGMDIDGITVDICASVGVALAPDHADSVDLLMQRAEIALFEAKKGARSRYELFEPALENAMRERQNLEVDLKAAFELGQFEMYYQPIVDLKSRRVTSVEALMRWRHPVRGMVSPITFIPLAEETGLIVKLGHWALAQACRDAATWREDVRVAVNLSAAQFQHGNLHKIAYAALRHAGLPSRRLELEVTESLLLRDEARNRRTLSRLKAMGIRIALDDFGTGYASLSYLRSFPFDKIKIDQTFVRDLPRNADCNAIVRSVVALARMLGMRTVAEGIETPEHLSQVVAAGCDEVQGYHFSRPVPADAIAAVIADCESRLAEAA